MDANIRGLVDRLDLAPSRGIMPLFEAISNAIDAIDETKRGYSNGKIGIRLIASHDLVQQAGDETLAIDGFDVTDDGVGFTDVNMRSFGEAYTLSKVKVGGKGVGRFTFLKVFSIVNVSSVFEKAGQNFSRSFQFSIDKELQGMDSVEATTAATGTKLSVRGLCKAARILALIRAGFGT